jgi:hypothetical protein
VIVHINHIAPSKKKVAGQRSAQSELAGLVTGQMMSMVEEGILDPKLAPSLRVHLDWIQYKTNFRDPVVVRRTADSWGKAPPAGGNRGGSAAGGRRSAARRSGEGGAEPGRRARRQPERHVYLDVYKPYRDCLIWEFNRLFWRHLADWEAASARASRRRCRRGRPTPITPTRWRPRRASSSRACRRSK